MSDYVIRPMTPEQVQTAVDWAAGEGWNPGHHDATCFRSSDPDGFLGGFLNGEMIASASSVNYDDAFSFLGFYIVRPEFRGSGYGLQVAEAVKARCEDRNMGMDGVVEQQDNYRKFGFKLAYDNYRFSGTVSGILSKLGHQDSEGILPLASVSEDLRAYDRMMFPSARDVFLNDWLSAPSHISRVCLENGQIKGYATLRPCHTGYKVGPLFADDPDIARALLASLLRAVPKEHQDQDVFIDMPRPNTSAFALVDQLGLDKVFETGRMYSSHAPDIDLNRIYGITSYELG
ncbi:GNAT family N-acetyltransferase [Ruegeria sp. 2205SS24-7]|uniref:GNAT family N-acetyltransferase n=1 Tax=Ruegeria discodermiae TaxID=3064389 RepID=UPI002742497B|nr:GNAT family N-acetyltransferase [Ruegeria sp. 2205SS24-7]MDP5217844.1 GNAT family N-acetyltransferase [Ruegeria sp. 2205SS24-7]